MVGVFIISKENPKQALLLYHKKLGFWLQPGGHIEMNENPIEAAIREVKEEIGINISKHLKVKKHDKRSNSVLIPQFFFEEKIPKYRNQPAHYHLDLLYAIEIPYRIFPSISRENTEMKWFTFQEIRKLKTYKMTKHILSQLMNDSKYRNLGL